MQKKLSKLTVNEIASRLQEAADRFVELREADGGDISQENYEKIFYEFAKIGEDVAGSSDSFKDTTLYDTYKDLIGRIRDTAIYISKEDSYKLTIYSCWISIASGLLFSTIVSFYVQYINDLTVRTNFLNRINGIRNHEIENLSKELSMFLSLYHGVEV